MKSMEEEYPPPFLYKQPLILILHHALPRPHRAQTDCDLVNRIFKTNKIFVFTC